MAEQAGKVSVRDRWNRVRLSTKALWMGVVVVVVSLAVGIGLGWTRSGRGFPPVILLLLGALLMLGGYLLRRKGK